MHHVAIAYLIIRVMSAPRRERGRPFLPPEVDQTLRAQSGGALPGGEGRRTKGADYWHLRQANASRGLLTESRCTAPSAWRQWRQGEESTLVVQACARLSVDTAGSGACAQHGPIAIVSVGWARRAPNTVINDCRMLSAGTHIHTQQIGLFA